MYRIFFSGGDTTTDGSFSCSQPCSRRSSYGACCSSLPCSRRSSYGHTPVQCPQCNKSQSGSRRSSYGSHVNLSNTLSSTEEEKGETCYNRVMSTNHRAVTKVKDVKFRRINKAKSRSLEELRGKLKWQVVRPTPGREQDDDDDEDENMLKMSTEETPSTSKDKSPLTGAEFNINSAKTRRKMMAKTYVGVSLDQETTASSANSSNRTSSDT